MSLKNFQLTVKNITPETADAITIEFAQPKSEKINYKAGQFLTLLIDVENEPLRRAYSFCTSPLVDENPAVTVKRVEGGKVSNHLNNHLQVGDTLEVMEAAGMFTTEFDENQKRHLILLGGGSGITPLMALLKTTLAAEPQSLVSLIYANRDNQSIIFKNQLEGLVEKYQGRLRVVHILEKAPLLWQKGYKGRFNTSLLEKILKGLPEVPKEQTEYFMCGPSGMMNQIEISFKELGLPLEKLRKEAFGISPEEAAKKKAEVLEAATSEANELKEREVTIHYAGDTFKFLVPPDKTILETALSLDIDLPYSCQSGMCTACMGRRTSGVVVLEEEDALTPGELDKGYVLTCVGHPMSDDVVIEIE